VRGHVLGGTNSFAPHKMQSSKTGQIAIGDKPRSNPIVRTATETAEMPNPKT
jgi:hypothetical protein